MWHSPRLDWVSVLIDHPVLLFSEASFGSLRLVVARIRESAVASEVLTVVRWVVFVRLFLHTFYTL